MPRRLVVLVACALLFIGAAPAPAEDHFFDSSGVKIHYIDVGHGEPVVLVHGFAVNGRLQWFLPGLAQALAKDYRVLVMDCRGHGLSDKPHDARDYGFKMGDDVIRLLDRLNIKKAHVVGYSMGGYVALSLLASHPDRLLSVTAGGAGVPREIEVDFLDRLADALAEGKGMGLLLERLAPPGRAALTPEQVRASNRIVGMFNDSKALSAAIRGLKDLAIPEAVLKANKVPTLAMVGDQDPLRSQVDEMHGRLANLTTVIIKDADHMNAFETAKFRSTLQHFLAEHGHPATRDKQRQVERVGGPPR